MISEIGQLNGKCDAVNSPAFATSLLSEQLHDVQMEEIKSLKENLELVTEELKTAKEQLELNYEKLKTAETGTF